MGKSDSFYYTRVFLNLDLKGASPCRLGVYWKLTGWVGGWLNYMTVQP